VNLRRTAERTLPEQKSRPTWKIGRWNELVTELTVAELRAEMSRAYLGFVWWVVEPVLYMLVFYVVFGIVFQRGGPEFVPTLLTGLIAWRWFDSATRAGMLALSRNKALMQQVYVPKIAFPLVSVTTHTAKFLIVFTLLLLFLMLYGVSPGLTWLALPLVLATQLLFITAAASLTGLLVPFLPDLRVVINNGLMLMFFLSGIFYMAIEVPESIRTYFFLNPMAVLIDALRDSLLHEQWPDWARLAWVAGGSSAALAVAYRIFVRHDLNYPKLGL
jgi:lipopolysaccharide transport system permease protein